MKIKANVNYYEGSFPLHNSEQNFTLISNIQFKILVLGIYSVKELPYIPCSFLVLLKSLPAQTNRAWGMG